MRVYWAVAFLLLNGWFVDGASTRTLRLLHVLFRHGNRNPASSSSLWVGNPFTDDSFYPEGFGQLTTDGKMTEYELGTWYRERYDTFLGDEWNIDLMDVRSTDMNRTKMSAELVLAGMWVPKGRNVWNKNLLWQPIPYNYVSGSEDSLNSPMSCPTYKEAYNSVWYSKKIQANLAAKYGAMMEIVSDNTGIDVDDFSTAMGYYDVMKIQRELGFTEEEWVSSVYPEPISSLALEDYYIKTNDTALKRIMSGALLKKILSDTQSLIDGTLSPSARKVFMYSAHDFNVGAMLRALDALPLSIIPPYGSTVVFEVHEIKSTYGFQLYYHANGTLTPLTVPGCTHFCPFDKFYSLFEYLLPSEDEYCQGT